MSYSAAIRAYISEIPLGVIICTRDVLHLGSRCAVDQCLYRLVKKDKLTRIAHGVFVKFGSSLPSIGAVVKRKAEAFGRKVASHGKPLAQALGLTAETPLTPIFCQSGGSSALGIMGGTALLAGTCDRKRFFDERPEGKAIRALWNLRREPFLALSFDVLEALETRQNIRLAPEAAWMPYWMSDRFIRRR